MLEILRKIVQQVNAADGLAEALEIIVSNVRESMGTEVCSVYMRDPQSGRLVFRATKGLNQAQVGIASLAPGEGLVGLTDQAEAVVETDSYQSRQLASITVPAAIVADWRLTL